MLIYIAGMHRSGTSATSRVLNLLGASLGDENRLMPAAADNPRGFWESLDVNRTNERLLGVFRGSWDHPPVLEPGWEHDESMAPWREEIGQTLSALTKPEAPAYAVKDPRLSLLLPLWQSVQPARRVVLPLREPIAVCQSLQRRNAILPERGAYLWLRYVTETLTNSQQPLPVIYRRLIDDADVVCEGLAAELGLNTPDDTTRSEIRKFLDQDLDHLEPDATLPCSPLLDLAQDMYSSLCSGVLPPPQIAVVVELVRFLGEDLDPGHHVRVEISAAAAAASRLEAVNAQIASRIAVQNERNQRLQERIDSLTERNEALTQRNEALTQRNEALTQGNEALLAAQQSLRDRLRRARARAGQLTRRLGADGAHPGATPE